MYVSRSDNSIISLLTKDAVRRYRLMLISYSGFMIIMSVFHLYSSYVLHQAKKGVTIDETVFKKH